MELQGKECSHLHHCSQQGRAYATHDAFYEQVMGVLLDAECGYGWHVERTHENPGGEGGGPRVEPLEGIARAH